MAEYFPAIMAQELSMEEIKAALMGQTVKYYDSWYGSSETVTVDAISFSKTFVTLKCKKQTISIPVKHIEKLVMDGKVSLSEQIDHCVVTREYTIKMECDIQKEIVEKKLEIARLKKEVKKLQENYRNYLASCAHIAQIRENKNNTSDIIKH